MEQFLRGECPHCRQPVEYPAEGTGQTVPCPTCGKPFVLTPAEPAAPAPPPPPPPPAPAPKPAATALPQPAAPLRTAAVPQPASPKPAPKAFVPEPLEAAYAEFERDPAFANKHPTREQVARAWALARFRKTEGPYKTPAHTELVSAVKELFREFRPPKTVSLEPRSAKPKKPH